jgi:undecaprenyl-diphosphatase
MIVAVILGLLQGITEWLPISSEGTIAAAYGFMLNRPFAEAVTFALWLHLGTVISVLIVFRQEFLNILKHIVSQPTRPTPLIKFLFVATLVSGVIGFPLLLSLGEISNRFGVIAMGLIGLMMFITGALQLRKREEGTRDQNEVNVWDAIIAGVAQGFAVLPGLSRSGLTVAALLYRKIDRREALVLSFLMSVPVSLGAGLYTSIDSGLLASGEALLAMAVAAVVGLLTIKLLLVVAQRVNFGLFVIIAGVAILAGALWQGLS